MIPAGLHPELAIQIARRDAERRLASMVASDHRPPTLRRHIGRVLLAWGARLAPPERGAPSAPRLTTTMVP